jgi:FtsP/CotA-like multicopper oxidase with cupredoxin domain
MHRKTRTSFRKRMRQILIILMVAVSFIMANVITTAAAPQVENSTAVAAAAQGKPILTAPAATLPAATCTSTGPSSRTCDLWATIGTVALPDGSIVPIWGYSDTVGGAAQLPGPLLIVNEGETVTVNLTNSLGEATALYFPGQAMQPDFVGAAASGGTATVTFVASSPGTFRYEAGLLPNAQHQVAMGMYGALIVRPSIPGSAYNSVVSTFDDEALLVLSEIDPALNNSASPATFDMRNYKPAYWLINGQAYPDTQPIPTLAGNNLLLRYVNAGLHPHAISLMGLDQKLLAEDGIPYSYNRNVVGHTIAAGQSVDVMVNIPAATPNGARVALYDGSMLLHNNNDPGFGGMMTFITTPDGPIIGDDEGPAITAVSVVPSPTTGSVDVTLSATVSDMATGGANILTAEYYLDSTTNTPITMIPSDGSFDSPTEGIEVVIPQPTVALLSPGDHTLYLRGQDVNNNWGPFNLGTLRIEVSGSGPTTKALTLTPNPSAGDTEVLLSGTADDSATGNNNIIAGEYFIGAPGSDGSGTSMTVNITSPIASIDDTLSTAALSGYAEGIHPIYVHSQDSLGIWGLMETIDLQIDKSGPDTPSVSVSPNPNNGTLPINQSLFSVRLNATLVDPVVAGVQSSIYLAEFFIDTVGADGTGIRMYARDGVFDASNEAAYALISLVNVAALAPGDHTIYVHGRDSSGNWGPMGTTTLTIDEGLPTVTATAVTPNPTGGAANVTLTAIASDADSTITNAEWFVDTDPGPSNGTPMGISFNGVDWDLSATINVTGWPVGNYLLYVRARDAAGSWSLTDSVVLNVNDETPFYGISLGPAADAKQGTPGATISYVLDVTNTGNTSDTYIVSIAGNGWVTTFPASVGPLAAGASAQMVVDVTISGIAIGGDNDTVTVTVTSQGDGGQSAASTLTTTAVSDMLYFSTAGNTAVPGVGGTPDDADIYSWDGTSFSRIFDASTAGLPGAADVDGVHVVDVDTLYLSFNNDGGVNVPDVGIVDDEDIVLYDAGIWSLYLDGNEVGLGDNNGEDVDAFEILPDGSILLSALGLFNPDPDFPNNMQDEDVIRCVPSGPLPITSCSWNVYFDGGDVGLADNNGEDVNGIAESGGNIYLTTVNGFAVATLSGDGADVFSCDLPTTGPATSCTSFTMFFDGSLEGVTDQIDAIDLP